MHTFSSNSNDSNNKYADVDEFFGSAVFHWTRTKYHYKIQQQQQQQQYKKKKKRTFTSAAVSEKQRVASSRVVVSISQKLLGAVKWLCFIYLARSQIG